MIRVFNGNDTVFTSNGDKIIKPIEAVITKNEEEYLELEAPLQYAEFLIQDNILVVDTPTGKKGYIIFNPVISNTIFVKAYLHYQEFPPSPADRGVTISHGKNLENCKVAESWDNVVTKLTPVGYNGTTLPEGFISIVSPYQKDYEKTIEFDLSESLAEQVEAMEEEISTNESLIASLENSVTILSSKTPAYDTSVASLQTEKSTLQARYNTLNAKPVKTEIELKEMAVISAQIPLIDESITTLLVDKASSQATLTQVQTDLLSAMADLTHAKAGYDGLVITDLRRQAQEYFNVNKYPQINYDLEAHLEGIVEIGDTVKVKHPDMRVDLLTAVTGYKLDILTFKFRQVEFGTPKLTLKGKLTEIEEKIEDTKETIKQVGRSITKYKSEYKRDNEEMVSKFTSELYGTQNGIYRMLEKNQSVMRQTASEISGTVSRVNADLSTDIATLSIKADGISATVEANYTELGGSIAEVNIKADGISTTVTSNYNALSSSISSVNIKANQIQLQVTAIDGELTAAQSTITQQANLISLRVEKSKVISEINQTAESVKIAAGKIDLLGYVTVSNLETAGRTTINGSNVTTGIVKSVNYLANTRGMKIDLDLGTIDSKGFKILSDGSASFSTGAVSIDDSDIIIKSASGFLKAKYLNTTFNLIGFSGVNSIYIGSNTWSNASYLYMKQRYIEIGHSSSSSYGCELSLNTYKIGLYGSTPVTRQVVNRLFPVGVTAEEVGYRLNTLITALNALGAINGSGQSD